MITKFQKFVTSGFSFMKKLHENKYDAENLLNKTR